MYDPGDKNLANQGLADAPENLYSQLSSLYVNNPVPSGIYYQAQQYYQNSYQQLPPDAYNPLLNTYLNYPVAGYAIAPPLYDAGDTRVNSARQLHFDAYNGTVSNGTTYYCNPLGSSVTGNRCSVYAKQSEEFCPSSEIQQIRKPNIMFGSEVDVDANIESNVGIVSNSIAVTAATDEKTASNSPAVFSPQNNNHNLENAALSSKELGETNEESISKRNQGEHSQQSEKSSNANLVYMQNISQNTCDLSPSSSRGANFNRGRRKDNFSNNFHRGRCVKNNVQHNSIDREGERNLGRSAALIAAATFMAGVNDGAPTQSSTDGLGGFPREGGDTGRPNAVQTQHFQRGTASGRGGRYQRNQIGGASNGMQAAFSDGQNYSRYNRGGNARGGPDSVRGGCYEYGKISRGARGGMSRREYNNQERDYGYDQEYIDRQKNSDIKSNSFCHNNGSRHRKPYSYGQHGDSSEACERESSCSKENSLTVGSSTFDSNNQQNKNTFKGDVYRQNNTRQNEHNQRASFGMKNRYGSKMFIAPGNCEEDSKNQRDELTELLIRGTYECMVCCDCIKQHHAIWSCRQCYNCFHLDCIRKWANSSTTEGSESGWRCPACNNQTPKRPSHYMCFCGKMREPEYNRRDVPHSCGELCSRTRDKQAWCMHKCNVLCHPGPCPPCMAYIKKWCGCGATKKDVRCSVGDVALLCGGVCGKQLSCKKHTCTKTCHEGECGQCEAIVKQVCHCGKSEQSVPCTLESFSVTVFECGTVCDKQLQCGEHRCRLPCHAGPCQPCQLTVERVTCCPCGKQPLSLLYAKAAKHAAKKDLNCAINSTSMQNETSTCDKQELPNITVRQSCSDPIPTCGSVCGKRLACGKPGSFHTCQSLCHEDVCPPCPLITPVRCRCGSMDQSISCTDLRSKADEVMCDRQCKKLRFCGRHRCGAKCCIDVDHVCPLKCGKHLACGKHRCQENCHRGNCQRCWETTWEEVTCHCGAAVAFPPIPCGSKPPVCSQLCARLQRCSHPVTHTCHPEETCPPCTMLMEAPCFGGHKTMRSTVCHLRAVSCGDLCDKPLPCGFHKCNRVCHDGPCIADNRNNGAAAGGVKVKCPQKCVKPRQGCGHPCYNPCHGGDCPNNNCREKVTVTCKCGNRRTVQSCHENEREYRAAATARLATQLQHVGTTGNSVDLSHILTANASKEKFKRLDCNEACLSRERMARLALALQIENPETRSSLGTAGTGAVFGDFLKDEAKKDKQFASMVHQALTNLVVKARDSKQRTRSHSFAPMSRDKRQFIHEYCKLFGCTSMAYDEEPKKNVVVTAQRGMCLLPVASVVEVVQRESGLKKVPGPVWGSRRSQQLSDASSTSCSSAGVLRKLEKGGSLERDSGEATAVAAASSPVKPTIDYFDFEN